MNNGWPERTVSASPPPQTDQGPQGDPAPDVPFTLQFGGGPEAREPLAAAADGTGAEAGHTAAAGISEQADPGGMGDADGAGPVAVSEERAAALLHRMAREFIREAPGGWSQLDVLISLTVAGGAALAYFTDAAGQVAQAQPPASVIELAHEHRAMSAQLAGRPWLRIVLRFNDADGLEAEYDFGDDPIPEDDRLPAEAYRADLATYPRERLPIWLAAYLSHEGRQLRPPQQAARAGSDHEKCVYTAELPPLPALWARWAVISAAFVAARSEWGPRIMLSAGWFEGSRHGGSTLYVLPGDRAVLSGGTVRSAALEAAYNGTAELPDLYAGAPDWVADPVLNLRAGQGLLSFCYWWDGTGWQHSGSPSAADISEAVPGVWAAETVIDVVCSILAADRDAVAALVTAAESNGVTRELLAALAVDDADALAEAWYQLSLAGVVQWDAIEPVPVPE